MAYNHEERRDEREEGKSFLIYHSEINQPIKKSNFNRTRDRLKSSSKLFVSLSMEITKLLSEFFSAMRFPIFPRAASSKKSFKSLLSTLNNRRKIIKLKEISKSDESFNFFANNGRDY